jgi:hypothetical protein
MGAMVLVTVPAVEAVERQPGMRTPLFDPDHQAAVVQGLRVAFDFKALPYPLFVCSEGHHVEQPKSGACTTCHQPLTRVTHTLGVAIRRAGGKTRVPHARHVPDWELKQVSRVNSGRVVSAVWHPSGNDYRGFIDLGPGSNTITARLAHRPDGKTLEASVPYWVEQASPRP